MNLRNVNWKSAFLASALLAASSVPAAAGNLYNQLWDGTGNMFASQNDTNGFGNFATTYDNFTFSTAESITGVDWVGGYFNPNTQGAITAFTVTFYADSAGAPGGALATDPISGTGGESFLGIANGYPMYLYSVNVVPFAAAAGTQYWLSVVPDIGFPPQWGWASGTGGDGNSYQCFFGACGATGVDMAFGLSGTTGTPEPVSFSLAGIGLGLVGLASWKRRKQGA